VFDSGRHAILLQEGHGHGTLKTLYAAKSLNSRQCELRERLIPMKSALSLEQEDSYQV
jgi:predicted HTH domain antitoxin